MPRKRQPWNPLLKSYPESEKVNSISFGAETLFTRLIAKSDDRANFYGSSRLILAYAYGHRAANGTISRAQVKRFVRELSRVDLVRVYVGDDKKVYLHVVDCKKAVRKDVAEDIRCPIFTRESPLIPADEYETGSVTNPARTRNEPGTKPSRRRNDSVTPTRPDHTRIEKTKGPERPRDETEPSDLGKTTAALAAMNVPAFDKVERTPVLKALIHEKIPEDRHVEILHEVGRALLNRKPPPPGKKDSPTGYALRIIKNRGAEIRDAIAEDEAAAKDGNTKHFNGADFNTTERKELVEKYQNLFPGITVVFDETLPFEPDREPEPAEGKGSWPWKPPGPEPGPEPGPNGDAGTSAPTDSEETEKEDANTT